MNIFHTSRHLLGASLLIAGTSIGVGMFAAPVVTAAAGFIPSFFLYIACWLLMVSFGFLVLEACIWMPDEANLITMSRKLLGTSGAWVCWALYLFLFYCLMTAHVAGGADSIAHFTGNSLPHWLSMLIYVAIFAPIIYLGPLAADRINIGMMIGVGITYLLFVIVAIPHIHGSYLLPQNWSGLWPALPAVLTAFGFQNLIPTLYAYMNKDHAKVRKAIWIGTSIPLALYLIWELLVLGSVPADAFLSALKEGHTAIPPLEEALKTPIASKIAQGFAMFALSTSFIGIAIAFFDFWADGLKWEKKGVKRVGLTALVFGIPLILTFLNPRIFISAIDLGGGFGLILLLGVLPILFVWSGRYYHGYSLMHQFVKGGKITLSILLALCAIIAISCI